MNSRDKFVLNLNSRRLLIVTISLQLAFFGTIALDDLNLGVPILRQFLGFIYLTFVPGILILGVLRINNSNAVEMLLYSAGLSLSFLMFIGFLMNIFYPLIGIPKPISLAPVLFTLTVIVSFLCVIFYTKNRQFMLSFSVRGVISPVGLLPVVLPFIGIFGAHFLKYLNTNMVILTLFAIISIFPLIISTDKFPTEMLPFLIWAISVSLVLSHSLAFKYIPFALSDGTREYYYADLVYQRGIWDPQIYGNDNTLLRTVMLHPIYAILLNMSLTDAFMIIHPLHYSLTPVALYFVFRRQTNEKIAFLSTFFFMSFHTFFLIGPKMTRFGIAELFLILFALLITDRNVPDSKKSLLLMIFALSIAVSHYGTAYIFMFALIASVLLLAMLRRALHFSQTPTKGKIYESLTKLSMVYVSFLFVWYMYTSNSVSFETLAKFLVYIVDRTSEMLFLEASYPVYALTKDWPFSIELSRNLIIIAYVFIMIGLIDSIWNIFKKKTSPIFHMEFIMLSIVFFGISASTFLPIREFNPARVLHLSLTFLAPFFVVGFLRTYHNLRKKQNNAYPILAVFLIIFFLTNTGFISEVLIKGNDYPPNILISKPRASEIDDPQFISTFYDTYFTDQGISSAKWLSIVRENKLQIYTDMPGIFFNLIAPPKISKPYVMITSETKIEKGYVFLRAHNIIKKVVRTQRYPPQIEGIDSILQLNVFNKIYTNGGSEIYYR